MTKIYPDETPEKQDENLTPSKETIQFLLDYSKALHVNRGKHLTYEMLLN